MSISFVPTNLSSDILSGSTCHSNFLVIVTAYFMWEKANKKIFDTTYKEYAKGIFRFVYFRVSDFELAQDLTADTFVRLWKKLKNNEQVKNPKALLYMIARGLIIDHYRKKKNQKTVAIDLVDEQLLSQVDDTEDELSIRQEMEKVLSSIKKIKKEYQEILLLHYVEDLSITEIADILNKKENAVRVLLHRALKSLKGVL